MKTIRTLRILIGFTSGMLDVLRDLVVVAKERAGERIQHYEGLLDDGMSGDALDPFTAQYRLGEWEKKLAQATQWEKLLTQWMDKPKEFWE